MKPDEARESNETRELDQGGDRRYLTEARVPSFNGEMIDLKPAMTSFFAYFTSHLSSPRLVEIRYTCLTEARRLHVTTFKQAHPVLSPEVRCSRCVATC